MQRPLPAERKHVSQKGHEIWPFFAEDSLCRDWWPGTDEQPFVEPVILQAQRPGRNRGRLNTEHMLPRQPAYFNAPNAGYLVPAAGVHRSASVSHQRPAQIIINNDNAAAWDDHGGHRPRSAHGGLYYDEHDHVIYERGRSGSRVRMRAPSPQPEFDSDTKEKLKDYTEMKKKQEEKEQQLRIEEKLRMDRLKKEADRIEKEKEEKKLKEKAIEEYKIKEEEERLKKKKQREEEDKEFEERMRKTLWANGYSRDQIERIIKKAEKQDLGGGGSSSRALTLNRPTYIKVHRKHLDPETLDVYHLPWEWDDVS